MKTISFDGLRASGKSSQLILLAKLLSEQRKAFKIIHEKDHEPFRNLALSWGKEPNQFFYLPDVLDFAKARKEVYQREIYPIRNKIDYLLFDRYFHTSAVYQQGILSANEIIEINLEQDIPNPDKSFIFICDSSISFGRMKKRRKTIESLEEIAKRRGLYIELVKQHPELYLIDTTNKSEDEVFEEVKLRLEI